MRLPGLPKSDDGQVSGTEAGGFGKESGASGKVVVIALFAGALLLFAILFTVAYRQKLSNQADLRAMNAPEYVDSVVTAESIRSWMASLPGEWVKVTLVEGQGFVLFTPCYSPNASLLFKSGPDSLPRIVCEYCDSLGEFGVRSIGRVRRDSSWQFRLNPDAGDLRILPVNDSLLRQFSQASAGDSTAEEAPFRDKLLLWTRTRSGGKTDSLIFVPKSQEGEFESLKAEDENPEGCGTEPAD